VSSHDSSMPPLEGINNERNADNDDEAPSNAQVMNGEPVVSEEVEVEQVLSELSDGESSNNSSMPSLEDNQPASFPVNATTQRSMVDSMVMNALALAQEARTGVPVADATRPDPLAHLPPSQYGNRSVSNGERAARAQTVEELDSFREFHEFMAANNANAAASSERRLRNELLNVGNDEDEASNRTPVLPPRDDVEEDARSNVFSLASSSSLPQLIRRSDMSSHSESSLSMPPLIQRDLSSSSDGSDSSMPRLVNSTQAATNRARGGESGLSRFRRMLLERQGAAPRGGSRNGNDDRAPTNPLTHLRDYGALRVFASATCPICLEDCNPIVALRCGHAMCEEDYKRLGGYLASDKDKCKAAAACCAGEGGGASSGNIRTAEGTTNERSASRSNDVRLGPNAEAEARVRSIFEHVTSVPPASTSPRGRRGNRGIPASVTIENTGSSPQRRGGARGTVWAWGITRHCDNDDCRMCGTLHRTLYSVSENAHGMNYESCYPLGSKVVPDGTGGLWIQEAQGNQANWTVRHKNKRREVDKYVIPRDAEMVSDGNGGIWAMSVSGDIDVFEVKRYMSNSTHDIATVPSQSSLYYGPGGKVWIYVESNDSYDLSIDDPLEDGLWLFGSHSKELLRSPGDGIGFSTGDVDSDGVGNLWLLEENEEMDALVLKRILANGDREETRFEFPLGGSEVYGCGSSSGVFVFHQSPECDDFEGQLTYISYDALTQHWSSAVIGECPTDTKFASDGNGGLWALMVDDDDECMYWKCNSIGMDPIHEWGLPFASTELVGG